MAKSTPERRTQRRLWLRRAAIAIACAVVGCGLYLAATFVRIPELPPAPELEGVELSALEPDPPSDALQGLLESPPQGEARFDRDTLAESVARLEEGRWFDVPEELLARLRPSKPFTAQVLAAVQRTGCVQQPPRNMEGTAGLTYRLFARGIEAIIVTSVARLQLDEGSAALADLVVLLEGLHRLQIRCAHGLSFTQVLQDLTDRAHLAGGYFLADDELSSEAQQRLGRVLLAVETGPSPLPRSVLREWAQSQQLWKEVRAVAQPSEHKALDELLEMNRRAHQRLLWLAEQPAGSEALSQPTPEEEHLEVLQGQPGWLVSLRIGEGTFVGLFMGAGMLAFSRPKITSYHATRCAWALRRARWLDALDHRGRTGPASLRARPPTSPFTGEVITPESACPDPTSEEENVPEPPPRGDG